MKHEAAIVPAVLLVVLFMMTATPIVVVAVLIVIVSNLPQAVSSVFETMSPELPSAVPKAVSRSERQNASPVSNIYRYHMDGVISANIWR